LRDESAGGGELVDDLPVVLNRGQDKAPAFDYIQQYTLAKYNDWALQDRNGIEIQEEELKALEKNSESLKLPCSMYLMGSLLKQAGQLDANHFTFDVAGLGGPSGANLLGRFTHGDHELYQYVKDILKAEEQEHPDTLYAEIAHLPQARTGNILLRPVLRTYEIPYVGLSGADEKYQIPLDDLRVSVRNNEIVLRSRKHNKRVIPRLTTAHNFNVMSLPVYKFLCDLQGQGLAYPNIWDWGHLVFLKHLPRVTYKNLIIRKALWKIEEQDLIDLPEAEEELPAWFLAFRNKLKIPERVVYKEGDNELLIDFTHGKGTELFLHYLKRHKTIKLEEFLFTEENCVVCDPDGAPHTNELIIPVYQATPGKPGQILLSKTKSGEKEVQRAFLPYSEWLYFKIYSGAKTAEHLLSSVILPFMEEGIESRLFERFFFIRYQDESGGHIRIRLFNTDKDRQLVVYKKMMQVLQPLMDNNTINRVMLDTYKREMERYTPELINASETIFHNDSLAVLRFIHLLDGIDGEQYRLLFAMRGIEALLTDFGLSLEQKAGFLKELQAGFFKEFGSHPSLQKQLNERYRKHQRFIADHMDERRDVENEIDEAAAIFNIRSDMNIPVVREIFSGLETSGKTEKINALLSSYIHMFVNRLFIGQQRKYELVVYHFLEKYYASRMAITKKEKQHALSSI
jgi:lantibiotic biosynthesis protein